MARTPLLNMLLNLSRERAAAERSERANNRPGSPTIARRTVLRGALDASQLHGAEDKGAKRSKGVHPNGQRRMRQGCKVHCSTLC